MFTKCIKEGKIRKINSLSCCLFHKHSSSWKKPLKKQTFEATIINRWQPKVHEPKGKADFHVLQSCQDLLFMPREVCTAAFLEAPPIHLDQRAPSSRHSPQIAYRPSKWRELKNYIKLTLKTHTNGIFSSTESLSHVRLCSRMDCSTPCLPVHHQLLELAQTHVH